MKTLSTKKMIMAVIASAFAFSATATAAEQNGTISFKGLIYNATCTINLNDSYSPNAEVKMGRFATSEFSDEGDEVGGTGGDGKLKVELVDCPDQGTVSINLTGNANRYDDTILELDNKGSTNVAKNIGIRIYREDQPSRALKVNGSKSEDIKVNGSSSEWRGTFIAKYVSTDDTVEAGQANATLNYKITYK
ncbi:fimbrial protein [Providencia vermicola]|uniref:Type 1 fimbrial protein n=4 Tax=Providencia TaxID=586 RepID=A0ABD5LBD8_PROST|nr:MULTISPECIES: fimbrial protein [Providencia]ELR5046466.1 type 1 fimbrial protein [Providencia rettgeri]ELR5121949.1 type 1 fimbrial protein [Providencia stuartii]ELR5140785.1 type 1 fimbrial protein [Providencia stuartii]ELR5290182.1 type 1 fimbrial protein [Providencia stuartii]ELX8379430.1 type 1 fimbrial protein [Providencia stuartii]